MHDQATDQLEWLSADDTDAAIERGAVATWWQLTTFVRVSGPDAVSLLDGIATQDIAAIEPGHAAPALLLTPKARIVAAATAYRVDAQTVLLEVDPDQQRLDELLGHIRRYRLRSKAEIAHDPDLASIAIVGAQAAGAAERLATPDADGWYATPVFGVPARVFVGTSDEVASLVAKAPELDIGLADPETLDAIRIERGVPWINDYLVDRMPAEVGGMEHAVSLTKGCYLGQEPVARLHYRGHPNRTLRQVRLAGALADDYGSELDPDLYLALVRPDAPDRPVGQLTSWARSPRHGTIGLAVLRKEVETGDSLTLAGSDVVVTAGI